MQKYTVLWGIFMIKQMTLLSMLLLSLTLYGCTSGDTTIRSQSDCDSISEYMSKNEPTKCNFVTIYASNPEGDKYCDCTLMTQKKSIRVNSYEHQNVSFMYICKNGEVKIKCTEFCNDNNACTKDLVDESSNECKYETITPCVGNGVCEQGEYGTKDCPDCNDNNGCTDDSIDYNTKECKYKDKVCNDNNKCTTDSCTNDKCKYTVINNCDGNKICEQGEYGTSDDCPTCYNSNECTVASYDYLNKKCTYTALENCCSGSAGCTIGVTKKIDDYMSVTLEKISIVKDDDEYFIRTYITVKNIGTEKIYFSPYDMVILGKSSNQFDRGYYSGNEEDMDSGDIYPGVIKKGAIFFELDPDATLDVKELIVPTGIQSYNEKVRIIGSGAFLYNEEYVFSYDLSNLNLKR